MISDRASGRVLEVRRPLSALNKEKRSQDGVAEACVRGMLLFFCIYIYIYIHTHTFVYCSIYCLISIYLSRYFAQPPEDSGVGRLSCGYVQSAY